MGRSLIYLPYIRGHVEPSYDKDIDVRLLDGSGIFNYTYIVRAVCHNCRQWSGGALNVNTTKQPWIYAVGPGRSLESDSKTASIGLHDDYGAFTMNMIQATGVGDVPDAAATMSGAASVGSPHASSNYFKLFHALFMGSVFVFFYPLGIICARVFGWVRFHITSMMFATILAFTGFFLAVYMSTLFNKSKYYNTPHQVIGLIIMIGIVTQTTLGFMHHRSRAEERTPKVKLHGWVGQVVLLLGIVNGGIGFNFAGASRTPIILYSLSVFGMALFYGLMFYFKSCWSKHKKTLSEMAEEDEHNAHYLSDLVPAPAETYQPQEPPRPYH
ncbi:MAG: hypothetical protein M1839_009512 [Geoglossum umbratile]|nr:MAG: hypothetical protein M1839_009512 [Geoglossum umbratile]